MSTNRPWQIFALVINYLLGILYAVNFIYLWNYKLIVYFLYAIFLGPYYSNLRVVYYLCKLLFCHSDIF